MVELQLPALDKGKDLLQSENKNISKLIFNYLLSLPKWNELWLGAICVSAMKHYFSV